ncbi:LpxD N-terminal domain-containing protein [Leptolyngbya sp. 7M]|uniref:LpxD N-terminal domain-containing protein n=1 Tax=Leptolyngbya sp. 7M TaxID=2812896 RepID=UPI001CEC01BC
MKVRDIAKLVKGNLLGDPDIDVESIADFFSAQSGQLAFYEKDGPLPSTNASCVVISEKHIDAPLFDNISYIRVRNPKLAFAIIGGWLNSEKHRDPKIHPSSVISPTAYLGELVSIGPFCVVGDSARLGNNTILHAGVKVGDNVSIGESCIFHPNVSIEDGCTIGDNVILHAGVVIGAMFEPARNQVPSPLLVAS